MIFSYSIKICPSFLCEVPQPSTALCCKARSVPAEEQISAGARSAPLNLPVDTSNGQVLPKRKIEDCHIPALLRTGKTPSCLPATELVSEFQESAHFPKPALSLRLFPARSAGEMPKDYLARSLGRLYRSAISPHSPFALRDEVQQKADLL